MGMYKSYIQEILTDLRNRFGDVASDIYPARPAAKQFQSDMFLVISIPYGVEDSTFVGETDLTIEVYAKNGNMGLPNLTTLQDTADAVLKKFPISTDRYKAFRPRVLVKGDDGNGFTAWLIQARLIIVNV